MKNRYSLILEIVWIIVGVISIAGGLRSVVLKDRSNIIVFFFMAVVAFGFAWFRHSQRTKK